MNKAALNSSNLDFHGTAIYIRLFSAECTLYSGPFRGLKKSNFPILWFHASMPRHRMRVTGGNEGNHMHAQNQDHKIYALKSLIVSFVPN